MRGKEAETNDDRNLPNLVGNRHPSLDKLSKDKETNFKAAPEKQLTPQMRLLFIINLIGQKAAINKAKK